MQESGMNQNYQRGKEKGDGSIVKQMIQLLFFLVLCLWLLYQIRHSPRVRADYDCDDIEGKLRNARIRKLLGRKGGLRSSSYITEGMELYGMDLIEAADRIKHVGTDEEEEDSARDDINWNNFGEFSTKEGKISVQEIQVNTSRNGSELDESFVRLGAVILKKDGKETVGFGFTDDETHTRVSKHESSPSRRSDIQLELEGETQLSSAQMGNLSKDMETSQNRCVQNISEKQSLNKSDMKQVHEEAEVAFGKESMRELLQKS